MIRYLDCFEASDELVQLKLLQLGNAYNKKDGKWKKQVKGIQNRYNVLNKDLISPRRNLYNKDSNTTKETRIPKKGIANFRKSRLEWLQPNN